MFLSDEGPTFEMLDFAYISICSVLYFTLRFYQYVCLLTRIRKANVFPEPVCAAPSMSSPFNATGIPGLWISVGYRYPQLFSI